MKKLNIELNVRRMEAKSILTTSTITAGEQITTETWGDAPARGTATGTTPVRAGF